MWLRFQRPNLIHSSIKSMKQIVLLCFYYSFQILLKFIFLSFFSPGFFWDLMLICFPVGSRGKEPTSQCRRPKRHEFEIFGLGRYSRGGHATNFSVLAWRIPWTEEPERLQSIGSQKSWTLLKWLTRHSCMQSYFGKSQTKLHTENTTSHFKSWVDTEFHESISNVLFLCIHFEIIYLFWLC